MGECEYGYVQQAALAYVAEYNPRQQQTREYHEKCHGNVRDHFADDEGGLAHRRYVDLLYGTSLLLGNDVKCRQEAAHHGDGDHYQRRYHKCLVVKMLVVLVCLVYLELASRCGRDS